MSINNSMLEALGLVESQHCPHVSHQSLSGCFAFHGWIFRPKLGVSVGPARPETDDIPTLVREFDIGRHSVQPSLVL